ncbi:MAG: ABC transporter ATP-binding protein [Anaerolineales bacterium]|nr:MAG: ABC transporter ATP-binding protein [Anaerolineales bacterium]
MLEVQNIFKSYEDKPLLNGISFDIAEGETVCLLGASGSGKSTLLRMIAGLESPDSGFIAFDGFDLASTPPHLRDFGLVFQDYALFPHLDVHDNVAFGLRMRRLRVEEITERVASSLKLVNLEGFEKRSINDLSGGEQQRVALARALAIRPRLLMLDEPLGALDRTLKEGLLTELRSILRKTKIPALYITHDQEEAFAIADRILILHDGKIIRDGAPMDLIANPQSAYVAEFLGLGNVIEAKHVGKNKFQTVYGNFVVKCNHKNSKGEKVHLLARPLEVRSEANVLSGVVADVIFQKDKYKVTFDNGLYVHLKDAPKVGKKVSVRVKVECLG